MSDPFGVYRTGQAPGGMGQQMPGPNGYPANDPFCNTQN